jgi:hypothetical protein
MQKRTLGKQTRNEADMKKMYFALPIIAAFLVRRGR